MTLAISQNDPITAPVSIEQNQPNTKITTTDMSNNTKKDVAIERSYWSNFYSEIALPDVPSQFCTMVSTEVLDSAPVVEFGCGNGRDSLYFASRGFLVFGSDLCATAIESNRSKAAERFGSLAVRRQPRFSVCDVTDASAVGALVAEARAAARDGNGPIVVYNRFFLHSIDAAQEAMFVRGLAGSMAEGDRLYMEFRCHLDEDLPKVYGKDHYRRYVQTDDLCRLLERSGYAIEYRVTGRGMAKYKSEDPFVSRIVAVKKASART